MKKYIHTLTAAFFVLTILSNCSEEEVPISFSDQSVEGRINGVSWRYEDGTARKKGDEIWIDLFRYQGKSGCEVKFPQGDRIFFNIPNRVGSYKLRVDYSDITNSRTIALMQGISMDTYIAEKGAIEILLIEENTIQGRVYGKIDKDTYVNGSFSITFCQ